MDDTLNAVDLGNDNDGVKQTPEAAFEAYGISGLTRYGAVSRVYEEFLRELQGPQGMKSYREMIDNDPICGAILFAANHLCRKVRFQFKAADDSQQAQWIASKIGGMLFDDLDSTWPDTLSEILTMLGFGWSLLEFTTKRRLGMSDPNAPSTLRPPDQNTIGGEGYEVSNFAPSRFNDGLIGFRALSLRSQETLFMWEFDDESNPIVMQQMAPPDYRIRRIPLSKGLLFRTQVAKNNPEGRSLLRNAWTSYYFKKNLQIFEGIGIERDLAGYPMIQIEAPDINKGLAPPDIWNPNDTNATALLNQLKKIVRSVRRDEQEGLVLPWWAKFSLVSTGSRRSFDTNAIIARYDQRMAMSVMADFIMLGHEAVGSKALAATKISLFTAALSSFLDTVCAVINRKAVTMLMDFNGWPQELAPSMIHGDVESVSLEELGTFIAKLSGTGFNPLLSTDAQRAVMELAKLPTTGIPSTMASSNGAAAATQTGETTDGNPKAGTGVGDAKEGEGDFTGGGGPVAALESTQGRPASLSTT